MLEQCKATVSYMVMSWTVNNTVAHYVNNKVDNKLVSGLTDLEMYVLLTYILKLTEEGMVQAMKSLWITLYEPLGVSVLHSRNI